jgi:aarF domain-containing kinase
MLRIGATGSQIARRAVIGFSGVTAVGGVALTGYAYSPQGLGFKRECVFWQKVFPVVFDYYWMASSSSPYVRYQKWWENSNQEQGEEEGVDNGNNELARKKKRQALLNKLHERHAPEIFNAVLQLKGLYVKLGQVLSVTALPIPEAYRVLFRTLQSDVPGWEEFETVVKPVLEKEFGRPLEEVFSSIDPIPCGAASIGQAHRATLLRASSKDGAAMEDEQEVVVKVQYPDAAWMVPADIQCVGDLLQICVWGGVFDESSARLSFEEFSRQFLAELDYEQECTYLQEVYRSSQDPSAPYKNRGVEIPQVFQELCTKRVITMTYLPGPKLEAEARRQLKMLGIDTSQGIGNIVRDAAKDAAVNNDDSTDSTVAASASDRTQLTRLRSSWMVTASRVIGNLVGVDSILWAVRFAQRVMLWSTAAAVSSIHAASSLSLIPADWEAWAHTHRTASQQAERLALTESWIDALFDIHGHQVFVLGLFNAGTFKRPVQKSSERYSAANTAFEWCRSLCVRSSSREHHSD